MDTVTFTQWECEVVIYRADDDGVATDEIEWLGGCDNRMNIEQGYAEERADRSGDRYARWQQLEEEHTIELERLFLTRYDRAASFYQAPVLGRNQRLVAVLLWRDEEARIWHKHTYYGVQVPSLSSSSENEYFDLKVPLRASHMIPASGDLDETPPDNLPSSLGAFLRYVDTGVTINLYSYDYESGAFARVGSVDSRLQVVGEDDDFQFSLLINGTLALGIDHDGVLQVKGFDFTGGTFADAVPRVEFMTGFGRIASLTETGLLAAPGFNERDTAPGSVLPISFLSEAGAWLASIDQQGVSAPDIADELT